MRGARGFAGDGAFREAAYRLGYGERQFDAPCATHHPPTASLHAPYARRVSVGPRPVRTWKGICRIRPRGGGSTALLLTGRAFAGTVNIALVPVGDAGNVADPATNYGAVAYPYSIGEYDVTMGQYTAFLNSVATSGNPYGLWTVSMSSDTPTYGITRTTTSGSFSYTLVGNSANVPVTYVSWGDAVRFVNWIQNGEPKRRKVPPRPRREPTR